MSCSRLFCCEVTSKEKANQLKELSKQLNVKCLVTHDGEILESNTVAKIEKDEFYTKTDKGLEVTISKEFVKEEANLISHYMKFLLLQMLNQPMKQS